MNLMKYNSPVFLGLCKNVGGDMVVIVMVCLYCNVWGCVCVGFVLM